MKWLPLTENISKFIFGMNGCCKDWAELYSYHSWRNQQITKLPVMHIIWVYRHITLAWELSRYGSNTTEYADGYK